MRDEDLFDFDELPESASWVHEEARVGFENVFIRTTARGWRFSGHTAAVEDQRPWTVRYEIGVDARWRTRTAEIWIWSQAEATRISLRHDGSGHWKVNGADASHLDGCLDVDLESSACTNTLPVHRIGSATGPHEAPAAYVRVDGVVERLEQTYRGIPRRVIRLPGAPVRLRRSAPVRRHGLVLHYPGIARRVR
jgi:Uncharacterized protein conserved in bacteria